MQPALGLAAFCVKMEITMKIRNNKNKQRGAAAIEYAILAAAMSLIMLNFLGDDGDLTKAINETYEEVINRLETVQNKG